MGADATSSPLNVMILNPLTTALRMKAIAISMGFLTRRKTRAIVILTAVIPTLRMNLLKRTKTLERSPNGAGSTRKVWSRGRTRTRKPSLLLQNLDLVIIPYASFFCVLINLVLATAYVPPHLRNRPQDEAGSEAMIKLTRQIKGLLNRFVLL